MISFMSSIQGFIAAITSFIGGTLLPFLFGLALLFFIFNAFRYFVLAGADEEGRKRARQLALYGITAFVFLVSIWGIVNVITAGFGFNTERPLTPDYIQHETRGG